ncbi:MAG: glycosyltransferase, partial [Colwellia sp.]
NGVNRLYEASKALVFPSLRESFGLPLIEASSAGLPIIASELDFVRDVSCPVQTFDPSSPVSIARAIARFLEIRIESGVMNTPDSFVEMLIAPKN